MSGSALDADPHERPPAQPETLEHALAEAVASRLTGGHT
jgi:hypothetical protein